jgi:glutamine cyclotransferase
MCHLPYGWADESVINYHYKVINTLPHNDNIFTQGIEIHKQYFYESAGQFGESRLIKRNITDSKEIKSKNLSSKIFAEGITRLNDKIYQLTWKSEQGFIYNANTFEQIDSFNYQGQGWGLCNNGTDLIMSNGSDKITFLNPDDFSINKTISVTLNNKVIDDLNELEWVNGYIYANVWQTNWIVIINPNSGNVVGTINLTGLLSKMLTSDKTDVLNGIAYDNATNKLYVTGKYWPRIYQIELIEKTR